MDRNNIHREQVAAAYPGWQWQQKVKSMSDERIHAIWCRIFKDKPKPKKVKYEPFYCE